jgi:N,N'-diacetyllegionaminate synthase
MKIGNHQIGETQETFIIAEVAQAHEGSLGLAKSFVSAIADTGAHAVKFQTHIAAEESTRDEAFRIAMSGQDATRYDYWHRMEFTPDQWADLASYTRDCGLVFLSSAFSVAAVELLEKLDVPAWKVGSGEVFNNSILDAMTSTGKPVLISTGMSSRDDIARAHDRVVARGCEPALFQCTSRYPTALDQVGLNMIDELRDRFGCKVGLSDHSATVYPALAAMAQGLDLLEVHVVFDRSMYGPDAKASLTFDELTHVAAANTAFKTMRDHPVDKDAVADELRDMRALFSKSLAPVRDIKAGETLTAELLTTKKPGTGIAPDNINDVLGRRVNCDVAIDQLLRWEDLDA